MLEGSLLSCDMYQLSHVQLTNGLILVYVQVATSASAKLLACRYDLAPHSHTVQQ